MRNLVSQSLKRQFKELGIRFHAVDSSGHWESKPLGVVSFADDTTGVTRVSGQPYVETAISDTLRQLGHKAHPDKFERSAADSQGAHLNADCWTPVVRFVGHNIDADGSTLASASQIWWKLKKKFQSSVCHSVFVVGFLQPRCSRVSFMVQKHVLSQSQHSIVSGFLWASVFATCTIANAALVS